ncbi:MAG: hypothetical protein COB51_00385 [Moraxellaceae bacterium]|nr:MAG: hypothetical protein COB51_00385 [Moraxellaceae bacterium]
MLFERLYNGSLAYNGLILPAFNWQLEAFDSNVCFEQFAHRLIGSVFYHTRDSLGTEMPKFPLVLA